VSPGPGRLLVAACVALLVAGCARMPATGVTSIRSSSVGELRDYLRTHPADVDTFRDRGPFAVDTREALRLSPGNGDVVIADLHLANVADRAPLVIVLHGQDNTRSDHAYQGFHLASWGLHTLVLQLAPDGPWLDHGRTLAQLVARLQRSPDTLDARIDARRIVLVGHSFGGTAVAVALGGGAPVLGAVLLDPASLGWELQGYLRRIERPVMIIGADEDVFAALDRDDFYQYVRAGVMELSVRDASHEDAQFPMTNDHLPSATAAHQITFVAALTSAALSLADTGRLDAAWRSYESALKNGKFIDPRQK